MTQLQLSLGEIATLARVARPVASVWRTRHAQAEVPFPAPVASVAGEDRFDADDVVGWLESTGLGNNPTVRDDAAAVALPRGVDPRADQRIVEVLSALLCLRVVTGADLGDLDSAALIALAAQADPDDTFLRREVEAAGEHLVVLAALADRRADAAYSSVRAFEQLLDQRFRFGVAPAMQASLAPAVHLVVERLAPALASECGAPPATYVEPTGRGNDLVMGCLLADGEEGGEGGGYGGGTLICPHDDTVSARMLRRRLRVHGQHRAVLPERLASLGPAVVVLRLPDQVALTPSAVLEAIDEIVLQLGEDQRAVILAPASMLTDRLRTRDLDTLRSQILRVGRVRAIVRLPRKLVTRQPRQALAMWVLGPDRGDPAAGVRRIAVADLSDEPLTPVLIEQLVEDVVAATAGASRVRAHSFARTRWVSTASVLAATGALVAPPVTRRATAGPGAPAVELDRLRRDVGLRTDPLGGLLLAPGSAAPVPESTIGRGLTERSLRLVAGNRHGFATSATANVVVLGVAEVTGSARTPRRVDRLTFLADWRANRLTEPGDVVFCTSPHPAAVVDTDGGSAVEYPARILRIHPVSGEGLSPHVLAHDINAQPAHAREWRSWPLRRVAVAQVPLLAEAAQAAAQERRAALARAADLELLAGTLIDAVCDGSLALTPSPVLTPRTAAPTQET